MLGIEGYDSEPEDETAPEPAAAIVPVPAGPVGVAGAKVGKQEGKTQAKAPRPKVPDKKVQELIKAVDDCTSATAVVQIVRRSFGEHWDMRWGAEALNQIAKRSTARTRKEWARDPAIKKLGESVRREGVDASSPISGKPEITAMLLVALDALRALSFMTKKEQVPALERVVSGLAADRWGHPVKTLARLLCLSAGLGMAGTDPVPEALRDRAEELDAQDCSMLLQAMRTKGCRDSALLNKVLPRLKACGYGGISATDLVEMAEGLKDLAVEDDAILRPLGQEVLRRKGELTPDESHRVHAAYTALKLPLPQVWALTGAKKKRDGTGIVTTQTFVPQEGHEKKRRGNHDLERVSPPRVVRDYKMMSY